MTRLRHAVAGLRLGRRATLTESIRPRIPKVAFQAEAGEDGTHLIGLRAPRVLLQARGIPSRRERP
jgi:hypothetical protein